MRRVQTVKKTDCIRVWKHCSLDLMWMLDLSILTRGRRRPLLSLSLRLHRILLRTAAAILQRIASAKADVQAILCNRAAPLMQPLCRLHRSTRGSGGSVTFRLNIHLPLLPLANSPLGSRGTRMPTALCARGSMTLRRAKAASGVPCKVSGKG